MSVIRQDRYSLLVMVGGHVFRPVHAKYSYLYACGDKSKACDKGTKYKIGDKVKAHHISQTPHGKVGDEYWASHGVYADFPKNKPTTECWSPAKIKVKL